MTATRLTEEPTLAQIFARMMERDTQQHEAWQQMALKVSDQSTAVQGLQMEMVRLVKLAEKQDGYNERQITLAERTIKHGETFDRAFKTIEDNKDDLGRSIEGLARELKTFSELVVGYRSSVAVLKWVMALVTPGMVVLVSFIHTNLVEKIADSKVAAAYSTTLLEAKHEKDMAEAKIARNDLRDQIRELRETRGLK